jgi:heptaprenylglyceryl phosphate synthase
VIKIDPASGKILGKIETSGTDFIEVAGNGDVLAGATTGGFFWYRQGD